MDASCRFLLALDATEASERAARYLGHMLAGRPDAEIHLLHVLPPLPPELLETGGAPTRAEEERIEAEQEREQERWIAEQTAALAKPLFATARAHLAEAGIDAERVLDRTLDAIPEDKVHERILDAARTCDCATVVMGRRAGPWIRDVLNLHVTHDVVKRARGVTVWVVG